MTIIAAINDPIAGTWLGADSLVSTEHGQFMGYTDKWYLGDGWALGFAGANSLVTGLRDYLHEIQADWTPAKLWHWATELMRDWGFTPKSEPGESAYYPVAFLFATPEAVWSIGGYGDAIKAKPHQLMTRGSASDFADGAAYAAARLGQPHEVIITEAIETAICLDGCCGGDTFIHLLKKETRIEAETEFQAAHATKPALTASTANAA